MNIKFKKLNKTIVNCKKCPRLTNFIKSKNLKILSQKMIFDKFANRNVLKKD